MSSIQNIQSPNYYQGVEQGPALNLSLLTEQATNPGFGAHKARTVKK